MTSLSKNEMRDIRKLLWALRDEMQSPNALPHPQRDLAELDSDIVDSIQRLTHAIGPELAMSETQIAALCGGKSR